MGIPISGVGNGTATSALATAQELGHPGSTRVDPPATEPQAKPAQASDDIDAAVRQLEQISLAFNKKLKFSVNRQLDEVVVEVIDRETDTVIRELPPEEIQNLHLKMREMIGLLFDQSA